ncbi:MAG: hypothetical protein ABF380_00935, partial [Akkermansiaceae bacterium]
MSAFTLRLSNLPAKLLFGAKVRLEEKVIEKRLHLHLISKGKAFPGYRERLKNWILKDWEIYSSITL